MQLTAYSVQDTKTAAFGTPFFSQNDETAIRSFQMLSKDTNSVVAFAPQDFRLFRLGVFDDQSGVIEKCQPEFLAQGGINSNTEKHHED